MLIARELGKHGITVNAYAPGVVETPMCQFLCLNASHPRKRSFFQQLLRREPVLARMLFLV